MNIPGPMMYTGTDAEGFAVYLFCGPMLPVNSSTIPAAPEAPTTCSEGAIEKWARRARHFHSKRCAVAHAPKELKAVPYRRCNGWVLILSNDAGHLGYLGF